MSNKAFDSEIIDQYLDGRMAQEERSHFEEKMAQNADLAEEVALQRDIRSGIDFFAYKNLKDKLKQSDDSAAESPVQQNPGNGRRLYTWIAVAASFSGFLLLGYLLLETGTKNQALVADYYQTYPNVLSPIDRSSSGVDDRLSQALQAYEAGAYQQAAILFEQNEEQMSEGHRFYLAMSYFELDQIEQSVAMLEQVTQKQGSLFYFPALWYQALAYLKTDQVMQAKENLDILTRNDNSYQEKAIDLLEALE